MIYYTLLITCFLLLFCLIITSTLVVYGLDLYMLAVMKSKSEKDDKQHKEK